MFYISIDTKQVKQEQQGENSYPIKDFIVPSKNYNKISKKQY